MYSNIRHTESVRVYMFRMLFFEEVKIEGKCIHVNGGRAECCDKSLRPHQLIGMKKVVSSISNKDNHAQRG